MQFLCRTFLYLFLMLVIPVSFAAPFAYITNIVGNSVSVIDTADNTVVTTIPVAGNPYGVATSSDGKRVYIGNYGTGKLSTIDAVNNTIIGSAVPVGTRPIGVALTPDNSYVYVANYLSHNVSVVDTSSNTVIKTIPAGQGAAGVAISPDGSRVYVSNYDANTVSVIDSSTNTVVGSAIVVGTAPLGILVSPDGTRLVVANSEDDTVTVIDTSTNLVIGTVVVGDRPIDLAITPDSRRVYITHSDNDVVHVVDTASQKVIAVIPVGDRPIGLDITPDGSKVYVANDNSDSVSVIDTCTNTVTNSIGVGNRPFAFGNFIGPVDNFIVGGSASGLIGNVILQNNGSDDLNVNVNCSFSFATTLVDGSAYNVSVLTQPANQICTVTNGSGTIAGANITNVSVNCITPTYTIGGAITGLIGSVTLQNNGADDLSLNADGSFMFNTALVDGSAYDVTVLTQPANQICSVANGSGTIVGANMTNVSVSCITPTYTVGGAIIGLIGSVTLQNNGADDLNLNVDGSFMFNTVLVDGSAYNVIVLTQPAGQICSVSNGSGTIAGTNITNVSVTCATTPVPPVPAKPIPTMSEWALIMLSMLLGVAGFARHRYLS